MTIFYNKLRTCCVSLVLGLFIYVKGSCWHQQPMSNQYNP